MAVFANHPSLPMTIYTFILIILAIILVWRVYKRVQSMMVSQRSIMSRHYTGVGVFTAMVLVAFSETVYRPVILTALLAATGIGIALGLHALRKTHFNDQTEFFTPPARIGLTVAMLCFARLMQIAVDYYINQGSAPAQVITSSPVTMAAVGLLGGYFGTYSAGLMRWRIVLRKRILRG